eukprot:Gregarina_sp_Poly_1__5017@NODE_265_length_10384_cov_23_891344_g231_i0_p3_GENE_NODE_265_length_10384_cov_23_891344_g231_i0NODE_265_length_10384_cov_23_891344_g231_i0_p3_ORF_typecomplete_len462_score42_69Hydrolase_4/PF12146_8/7e28Abhydrolase_1/PF00561_20/2_1e26Abhydrolase_6/PF12697_7/3_7e16DUF1057/PF06342_12/1_1e15DLH/PF01738_18/8_1e10Abhydrolase_2/PF02230_16/0_00063Abhydrolase_2/PF02230_16/0_22Abhydrolase_2/PF02230_16/3_6e03Chlorophyllase2/PF12740_7/7_3e08DUF1100/PF06500_11/8_3e07FSH1/PF03959_13/
MSSTAESVASPVVAPATATVLKNFECTLLKPQVAPQDVANAPPSPEQIEEDRLKKEILRKRKRNRVASEMLCPYSYAHVMKGTKGPINYALTGNEGPLVITFHGLNGTRMTFQDVSENLRKFNFRVLTFDLYGHGLSACPSFSVFGANYNTDFFCDQTDDILKHLHLQDERYNLIGFSMGCVIATAFAKRHLAQIDRIVLISPAGLIKQKPLPVRILKTCQCYVPCIPALVCKCCFCQRRFITNFTPEERENGSAKAIWDRMMWLLFVKKGSIPAFLGCVSRLPLWDAREMFAEVGARGIPTLILWGAQDTVVPLDVAGDVTSCFVNSHLIVFSYSSHLVLADAAAGSIASILTFFQFPSTARLEDFQYLLPFSPEGLYRKPNRRRPPDMAMNDYFKLIKYRPEQWIKLPNEHRLPTLPASGLTAKGRTIKPDKLTSFERHETRKNTPSQSIMYESPATRC